jgi:hypothetical protein
MKDHKGYEKLNATEVCDEQYKQKRQRLNRVEGYGNHDYYGSESGEVIEGGFIRRNNVREQL